MPVRWILKFAANFYSAYADSISFYILGILISSKVYNVFMSMSMILLNMYLFVKFKMIAEKYQQVNLKEAAAQKQQVSSASSNPFEKIDCV